MKKRILSLLMVLCLIIGLLPTVALAAESRYEDTDGHWAETAIDRWSDYGILQGSNGIFRPDHNLTRGEMAAVLSRLLGLKPAQDAGFSDVDAGAWYAEYINNCAAAGILQGYNGLARPNDPITREEAMVVICRAISISAGPGNALDNFNDKALVSDWAVGSVSALIDKGIVNGVGSDELAPGANITRASIVTILNRAIGAYANKAGATVEAASAGITLIAAGNVTVTGSAEAVLVAQGAQDGTVTMNSRSAGNVIVTAENATVVVGSQSEAENVTLAESAVGSVVVIEKNAKVGTVDIKAPQAEVSVSGKVENITVADTATDATITAGSGSTINKVDNAAEGTTVSGSGKVENVTTSGDNTTVSTIGTKVEVAEGTSGTIAGGKAVAGGETVTTKSTSSGGGSSSGGSSHSHNWGDGEVTTAATCTAVGVKTYTCSCGATKTEEIAALGHTEEVITGKAATCTETGLTEGKKCSVCGEIIVAQEEIPATGHTEEVIEGKAATCTEAGLTEGKKCSVCSEILVAQEEIAAPGHTWGTGTTTYAQNGADGTITYTCSACGATKTDPIAMKFYFGVSSADSTVDMTVGADYTAVFTMPADDAQVSASSATITAKMKDVASLGVAGEERSHEITVNTGIQNTTVTLSEWLDNCYAFNGATIKATIDEKECTYTFAGVDEQNRIIATTDTEAARAAWQALTSHVTTSTQSQDDSYILIANGSYIKIGTEYLHFESASDDLKLDNFNDLDALNKTIRAAAKLDTNQTNEGGKVTLFVKAGTQLAVGQSIATLDHNCTIEINVDADELSEANISLATLRAKTDKTDMVKALIEMFDEVIGVIDSTDNVTVNMTFAPVGTAGQD